MTQKPEEYKPGKQYPVVNGYCPLCDEPYIRLIVDHCHEHGWVRGRICSDCNVRLGFIEKRERANGFSTVNSYHPDYIRQLMRCPECSGMAELTGKK